MSRTSRTSRRGRGRGKVATVDNWSSLVEVEGEGPLAGIWEMPDPEDPKEVVEYQRGDPLYEMICDPTGESEELIEKPIFASDGKVTLILDDTAAGSKPAANAVIEKALRSNPIRGPGQVPSREQRCTVKDLMNDIEIGHSKWVEEGIIKPGKWNFANMAHERFRESPNDGGGSDDDDDDAAEEGTSVYTTPTLPFNTLVIDPSKGKDGLTVYLLMKMVRDMFSTPEKANAAFRLALTLFSGTYMKAVLGVKDTVATKGYRVKLVSGTTLPLPLPTIPPSRDDEDVPPGCTLYLEDIAEVHFKSPYNGDAYAYHKTGSCEVDFYAPGFGYKTEDGETEFTDMVGLVAWALEQIKDEEEEAPGFDLNLVLDVQGFLTVRMISFTKKSVKAGRNKTGTNISLKRVRVVRAIATGARFEAADYSGGGPSASTAEAKKQIVDDADDF